MSHQDSRYGRPPSPKPLLIVQPGTAEEQRIQLSPGVYILGRDAHCDVCFDPHRHRIVGRTHARLEVRPHGVYLSDLHSANGTFMAGEPVQGEVQLHNGEQVELGQGGPIVMLVVPSPAPVEATVVMEAPERVARAVLAPRARESSREADHGPVIGGAAAQDGRSHWSREPSPTATPPVISGDGSGGGQRRASTPGSAEPRSVDPAEVSRARRPGVASAARTGKEDLVLENGPDWARTRSGAEPAPRSDAPESLSTDSPTSSTRARVRAGVELTRQALLVILVLAGACIAGLGAAMVTSAPDQDPPVRSE